MSSKAYRPRATDKCDRCKRWTFQEVNEQGLRLCAECQTNPSVQSAELPLVGLIEIAMRAGVRRPVVSMWRTRYSEFPEPVEELAVGPVFSWPQVARWLIDTGRSFDANWSREDIRVPWESQKKPFQDRRKPHEKQESRGDSDD